MIKLIAHRGLKTNQKENTIKAFQDAIDCEEYVGFECDIRTTKDHVFVCVHDPIIENDIVSFTSYKDLKKKYSIPTLEEILSLNTQKIILLELKEVNVDIGRLHKVLQKFANKNIYVMSFFNSVIKKMVEFDRAYKLGVLNYVLNSEETYHYDFICLLEFIATENLIRFFHEQNMETFLYGIHHFDEIKEKFQESYFIVD